MKQGNTSTFHPFFIEVGLNPKDFQPKFHKDWKKQEFGNYCKRGPKGRTQNYFYPIGWKGYGLNVKGKYDNVNDNWLSKDNNEEEWCVMFYGTTMDGLKGILQDGFKESETQMSLNNNYLMTKQKIEQGVYFSNHIEVCEIYGNIQPTKIGDQEFIVVLQVRIRPEALRQIKKRSDLFDKVVQHKRNNKDYDWSLDNMDLWDNDYFVVNKFEDIRPYRILLKNVSKCQIINTSQYQKKELDQPLQYFKNTDQLDKKKSSLLKFKSQTEFQELNNQLKYDNKLVNPLNLVINSNIDVDNLDVLFYVLCDQMAQVGRQFNISLQPNDRLMYSFHGQFAADSNDSQAHSLILQETTSLTYEAIAFDEKMRNEFINKCRIGLSIDLKVSKNQIQIIAIQEGSIKVIFEVKDVAIQESENFQELQKLFPGTNPQLKVHSYFHTAALSSKDFNPKYNFTWDHHKFGDYDNRGPKARPQPYFFPIGWKGYALNVEGRYGDNDNWLMMNGNEEEWYVMFHGTTFWGCKGIMQNKKDENGNVIDQGRKFNPGRNQEYKNQKCLLTDKVIGKGVYFSNHIEVCEQSYTESTQIGTKKFIVAFQSRVRPEALRQCKKASDLETIIVENKQNYIDYEKSLDDMTLWDNDYFVINNTCDIRPYRILLKEVTKIQNQQNQINQSDQNDPNDPQNQNRILNNKYCQIF